VARHAAALPRRTDPGDRRANFQPDHLRRLLDKSDVVPVLNQIELHPYLQQSKHEGSKQPAVTRWSPRPSRPVPPSSIALSSSRQIRQRLRNSLNHTSHRGALRALD